MFCPKCGKELKDTALFCAYCGEKFDEELPEEPSTVQPKKKGGKAKIIIPAVAVLVFILGAAGVLTFNHFNNPILKIARALEDTLEYENAYSVSAKVTVNEFDMSISGKMQFDDDRKTIMITSGESKENNTYIYLSGEGDEFTVKASTKDRGDYYQYVVEDTLILVADGETSTLAAPGLTEQMTGCAEALFALAVNDGEIEPDTLRKLLGDDSIVIDGDELEKCCNELEKALRDGKWLEENLGFSENDDKYAFNIKPDKTLGVLYEIFAPCIKTDKDFEKSVEDKIDSYKGSKLTLELVIDGKELKKIDLKAEAADKSSCDISLSLKKTESKITVDTSDAEGIFEKLDPDETADQAAITQNAKNKACASNIENIKTSAVTFYIAYEKTATAEELAKMFKDGKIPVCPHNDREYTINFGDDGKAEVICNDPECGNYGSN